MLLFLSGVFQKFGGLVDFWLLLQSTREVPCYQIGERTVWLYPSLAKRQKRTCFLHDLQSFIYVFRISYLFIYVFITWYIHNLVSWVFMLFNDFFSNFLTPGNAARIYCWHRGSNILVETHVIFCFNVTSEFLHQISEFFVFILV